MFTAEVATSSASEHPTATSAGMTSRFALPSRYRRLMIRAAGSPTDPGGTERWQEHKIDWSEHDKKASRYEPGAFEAHCLRG